jgi:hypothetical protein
LAANCGHSRAAKDDERLAVVELSVAYRIIAARESETVSWERNSKLIAIAKARVWASEGWDVEITDVEGKTLDAAEYKTPANEAGPPFDLSAKSKVEG